MGEIDKLEAGTTTVMVITTHSRSQRMANRKLQASTCHKRRLIPQHKETLVR